MVDSALSAALARLRLRRRRVMCTTRGTRARSPPAGRDRPSFTEGVAQRVLDACRRDDADARITYVGRNEDGRTRVRVHSGGGASVQTLQRSLQRLMPYAKIRTSEDVLDGSVQVEIIVPTAEDEWCHAWELEALKPLPRALLSSSLSLLLVAFGVWLSTTLDGRVGGI